MSEELELMLAERAIQRVLTSYSRGVDRFDFETARAPAAASPTPTFEAFAPPMTSSTTFSMSREGFRPQWREA
jgi:hypothetical protein